MKKHLLITLIITFLGFQGWSQEASFTARVSTDSVLLGNHLLVEFILENAGGENFSPPEFADFDLVGGPNQSSSMSFVNGSMSQSLSYSYYLKPREVGTFFIEPSSINTGEVSLETQPIEINVYPNPDGIQQDAEIRQEPRQFDIFSSPWFERRAQPEKKEKPKKKRKVYRI